MTASDAPLAPAPPDVPEELQAASPPDDLIDGELEAIALSDVDLSSRDVRGLTLRDAAISDVVLSDGVLSRARLRT